MASQQVTESALRSCSKTSNSVTKSKRKRFQDEDDQSVSTKVDYHLKELLAKELSDYLDRTIEEIQICDEDHDIKAKEDQPDDFKLFSSIHLTSSEALTKEKQPSCQKNCASVACSSGSEDDEEARAKLAEASVSAREIFGSQFKHHT